MLKVKTWKQSSMASSSCAPSTWKLKDQGLIANEDLPGDQVQTDDQLREFVRNNAWGHHASCTCQIGRPDEKGVLRSDFRVHSTQGLRVVDASVFPRIPGLFILGAIYVDRGEGHRCDFARACLKVKPFRARDIDRH